MSNDGPSEKAKALIDENLRRVFREIVEEPLPDRFVDLLDSLRNNEQTPPDGAS